MPALIIIAFLLLIIFLVRLGYDTHKHTSDSDYILICRDCLEKRYDNEWLGFRSRKGICQVCHNEKIVDRRPIGQLQPIDPVVQKATDDYIKGMK